MYDGALSWGTLEISQSFDINKVSVPVMILAGGSWRLTDSIRDGSSRRQEGGGEACTGFRGEGGVEGWRENAGKSRTMHRQILVAPGWLNPTTVLDIGLY